MVAAREVKDCAREDRRFIDSLDPFAVRVQKVHKFVRVDLLARREKDHFIEAAHTVKELPANKAHVLHFYTKLYQSINQMLKHV